MDFWWVDSSLSDHTKDPTSLQNVVSRPPQKWKEGGRVIHKRISQIRPRTGVYHLCLCSYNQNSVIWPHLNAMEAGFFSGLVSTTLEEEEMRFLKSQVVFVTVCPSIGEGNGNPLQYSFLKNPMDGGAW